MHDAVVADQDWQAIVSDFDVHWGIRYFLRSVKTKLSLIDENNFEKVAERIV